MLPGSSLGLKGKWVCTSQVKPETLHDAAKLGDTEAAEALIAEGAEVNTKDKRGITPLGVAVSASAEPRPPPLHHWLFLGKPLLEKHCGDVLIMWPCPCRWASTSCR